MDLRTLKYLRVMVNEYSLIITILHLIIIFRQMPRELIQAAKGREVNLIMEDHRNEVYVNS